MPRAWTYYRNPRLTCAYVFLALAAAVMIGVFVASIFWGIM